jgi:hypothetical protein
VPGAGLINWPTRGWLVIFLAWDGGSRQIILRTFALTSGGLLFTWCHGEGGSILRAGFVFGMRIMTMTMD